MSDFIKFPKIAWSQEHEDDDMRWTGRGGKHVLEAIYAWSGEHAGKYIAKCDGYVVNTGEDTRGTLFEDLLDAQGAAIDFMKTMIAKKVHEARVTLQEYAAEDEEPLNFNGPTRDEVMDMVRDFLSRPIKLEEDSDSWRELTNEELQEVWLVFSELVSAKFEQDHHGDHQIEFAVADRAQDSLLYVHVPHNPMDNLEKAMAAVRVASSISDNAVKRVCGSVQHREADKREAREWKEKCAKIIEACTIPGLIPEPANSYLLRWANKGELNTGYFSRGQNGEIWQCFDMSVDYVHQALYDREDKNQPFEAINAACERLLTEWDEADTDGKIKMMESRKG